MFATRLKIHSAEFDYLQTGGGQPDRVVVFEDKGRGFVSTDRRPASPLGCPLLTAGPFLENSALQDKKMKGEPINWVEIAVTKPSLRIMLKTNKFLGNFQLHEIVLLVRMAGERTVNPTEQKRSINGLQPRKAYIYPLDFNQKKATLVSTARKFERYFNDAI